MIWARQIFKGDPDQKVIADSESNICANPVFSVISGFICQFFDPKIAENSILNDWIFGLFYGYNILLRSFMVRQGLQSW